MRLTFRVLGRVLAVVGLLLAVEADLRAQSASATLVGRVLTEDGKPVPDAVVQVRQESTGTVRTTLSDRQGRYSFEGLTPATWTVVARPGDGAWLSEARTVTLRLQQTATVDFSLSRGLEERITVRAASPLVDRQETGGKLSISAERTESLPVSSRVMTDLALLDSSVRRAAPGTFAGERGAVFTVNGQSGRSNSFLVDGLDNNDSTSGTAMNSSFSQEVIQEFVLLTHQYAPEYGGATGGLMNVVTRQGGNERTFGGFLQGTDDRWNQTGNFVEALPAGGTTQKADQRLQAGVSLGGPLRRDRAFYFAAFEHQQARSLIPYTGVDGSGNRGGRYVAPSQDDSLFLRTDFNLGTATTLMLRLSANDRSAEGVGVGGISTPESGFSIDERDLQLAATLTTVLSPNVLGESRILIGQSRFDQSANSDRPGVARPQGIFGGNVINRQNRREDKYQLVENLTWRTGRHTLKFGFNATRSTTDLSVRFNPSGNFTYDYDIPFEPGDCRDILVTQTDAAEPDGTIYCNGDPNGFDDDGDGVMDEPGNIYSYPVVYALINGEPDATLGDTRLALFAQDQVDVGRRWVLEYGLRYDLSTYTLPRSARVESTIPNGGAGRDKDNIAPRFGFTFTPKIGGKLVLRGGAGVFYDKLVLAFPATAAVTSGTSIGLFPMQGFAFEFTEKDLEGGASLPLASPESLTLRFSTGTDLQTPYSVQWNLGLERAFGRSHAIRADIVRSRGYHLPLLVDLNPVSGLVSGVFGIPLLTGELSACPVAEIDPSLEVGVPCHARDPARGSIAAIVTEGRSWYRGLDLKYRWQRELSWFQASYTLSRAEDQGFDPLKGGISLPPDSYNIAGERGRTDSDRLHVLVLSGDLPLPYWGLRSSAVLQLSSGLPYNVTTGQDDNDDGILTDRPPGVGRNQGEDSSLAAINAVRDQEVVPLAPLTAMPGEPSFFQIDLRLYKQFEIGETGSSEFFLQVFNLLDRENIGLIEGRAVSPDFGKPITLAGPPRTLELGLRLRY